MIYRLLEKALNNNRRCKSINGIMIEIGGSTLK